MDWQINDPAGQDLETVRRIVQDIEERVRQLLSAVDRQQSGAKPVKG